MKGKSGQEINANEAVALAAQLIAASDRNLKLAAEYLEFAVAEGKTQRQIAEGVGKSAAWVNRLLQWRRDGYAEDTPFGMQSQERDERHDERIREDACSGPEQKSEQERSGPKHKSESASSARQRREWQHAWRLLNEDEEEDFELSKDDRTTLVRMLGMLGSSNDHEVLVAARKAEEMRIRLRLTWDNLIVKPKKAHSRQQGRPNRETSESTH
jgi:hypothetical protein